MTLRTSTIRRALLLFALAVLAAPAAYAQQSVTFTFTGAAQTFTVLAGVTKATFDVYGAQGGAGANKLGLDTAVEALKLYRERRKARTDELLRYATVCRVRKIIQPYLEALL